jgi:uncharacterized integral membrane protein
MPVQEERSYIIPVLIVLLVIFVVAVKNQDTVIGLAKMLVQLD